jgi:hypothetical protein
MLLMNAKMRRELHAAQRRVSLPSGLARIVEGGFYSREGCALLAYFREARSNVSLRDFEDRTGYECFVNAIQVALHQGV